MTDDALRDAWLTELWPVCREVPHGERVAKRQADWEQRITLADRAQLSTGNPPVNNAA